MILYLDTSSLVKIFAEETGSETIHRLASGASVLVTSAIAYVEARSAFARKRRLGECTEIQFRESLTRFESDWPGFVAVDATVQLIRTAGDMAEKHSLRAYDAVHLASALAVNGVGGTEVTFSSADHELRTAAQNEGLRVDE